MRSVVLVFLLAVELGWLGTAGAQPASPSMDWVAPPECPSAALVEQEMDTLLGQPWTGKAEASLVILARIERLPDAYRLELVMNGRGGERYRELEHTDCAELSSAGALLVAMAIDPEGVQERSAARDGGSAGSTDPDSATVADEAVAVRAATPVPEEPPSTSGPGRSRERPLVPASPPNRALAVLSTLHVGVAGQVGAGVLPGSGNGLSVEMGLAPTSWLLARLEGDAWVPREITAQLPPGGAVRFSLWGVGASACGRLGDRWELAVCPGAHWGWLRGSARNITDATSKVDRWSAVTLGLRGAYWPTQHFGAFARLTGGVAVESPRYGVADARDGEPDILHRPEGQFWRIGMGILLRPWVF